MTAYAVAIGAWFLLHLIAGDQIGWLAMVNTFAPYLFVPLPVVLFLGLLAGLRRTWLALLLPLAVFVVDYGGQFDFGLLDRGKAGDRQPALTVMTFNAWGYSTSAETAQAIAAADTPDVVVLQELSSALAAVIEDEIGSSYPYRLLKPGKHKGILSRFPLTDLDAALPDSIGWFTQAADVDVAGRQVTIYNVHLYATTVLSDIKAGRSVGDGLATGADEREEEARSIAAEVAQRTGPVIVAGDLNATDQSRAYRLLTRSLGDAHRQAGNGLGHTFPAYGGSFRGLPIPQRVVRIDMVLFSDELEATDCRVVSEHGESDHLPVVAGLAWKGKDE